MSRFNNRTAIVVSMVLCAVLAGCTPAARRQAAELKGIDDYVRGVQLYRAGNHDAAIAALENAVAANPELRMAHSMLGDAYRARGDYLRASVHFEAATRLDPYTSANHYNLGVSYQFLNRLQDAAAAYLRALQLNPQDVRSNMNLGLVYMALGQLDDAVTYLERATRLDPNSAAVWSNLGVALDARGSTVLAESTYRKALELDSDNPVTLQNLAANLISRGKGPEALSIMEQVVARHDTPSARKRYGDALALVRRYDQAMRQYDAALQADPKYLPAINEKAFVLIRQYTDGLQLDDAQRQQALELWRRSLRLNPNQPRVAEALRKWEKPGLFGS